jgi:hypothetical protein
MAGVYDIVIAGGVESMSRIPMGSARMGQDPYGSLVNARFSPGLVGQGIAAELVAANGVSPGLNWTRILSARTGSPPKLSLAACSRMR